MQQTALSWLIQRVTWENFHSIPAAMVIAHSIDAALSAGVGDDRLRNGVAQGDEGKNQNTHKNRFHLSKSQNATEICQRAFSLLLAKLRSTECERQRVRALSRAYLVRTLKKLRGWLSQLFVSKRYRRSLKTRKTFLRT